MAFNMCRQRASSVEMLMADGLSGPSPFYICAMHEGNGIHVSLEFLKVAA